jgi:septal ring factor EnvC (AmiA/AmiB activator)
LCQISFSQTKEKYPTVIVLKNDTLVCYTTLQSKQMAVWNEQRKECSELQQEDKNNIQTLNKITRNQSDYISNLEKEIKLHKKTIEDKNKQFKIFEDEKKSLNIQIRKQRRDKIIAIAGGLLITSLLAIF